MDNSTLPPLFDNMDNVDISSPLEDSEIFQSAIQVRDSFVFLIIVLSFFSGCQFGTHYRNTLSNYSYNAKRMSSLIFRLCATTTPHIIYAGAKTQETS